MRPVPVADVPSLATAERVLRVDLNIYPVFTDSKVRLPG